MQSDLGKLFVGGISWDTDEERLHEYFSSYGEVLECVIMKDRNTGRARGFGFVVFADPAVAERVIKEKHTIDDRMVEAKKAVRRDDQSTSSRNSGSIQGSPGPGQTRKIFVGGLASTVTEPDFKRYFQQFGVITDVVVMYDHNTKRPRGFGFITYDSEDAVEKVLLRTFHELNGKMVEVKRAVPKELSPGPSRSMRGACPYGLSQTSSFLNGYTRQACTVGGYDVRMDGRFSLIDTHRSGYATYGSGHGMGLNFEPTMKGTYGTGVNYNNAVSYGLGLSPFYVGNSSRFRSAISFDVGNESNTSFFSSHPRNLWANGRRANGGGILGNTGLNFATSVVSPQAGAHASSGATGQSYGVLNGSYDVPSSNFYASGGSAYGGDPAWDSEQDGSGSFCGYGLDASGSDVLTKRSPGYVGYSVTTRQPNRGIAG